MAEPLDPRLVYARTDYADDASPALARLSPPAKRLLRLIDGRRALAQLPNHVRPGELPGLLDELVAYGLIVLAGILEELPAGWTDARDPRLDDFKQRIRGSVEHELGTAGRVLEARLQDCVNMTVMRGVLREVIELVRTRASAEGADRVAAAAQAANTAWAARESGGSPPRTRG